MELKPITWRAWAFTAFLVALYLISGIWLDNDGAFDTWVYRIGLTGCALVPLVFVSVYTLTGNKFWQNEIGTALARVKLSLIPSFGPLAYVFWFRGGVLNTPYLAWLAISGPILTTSAVIYQTLVFGRISRKNSREAANRTISTTKLPTDEVE